MAITDTAGTLGGLGVGPRAEAAYRRLIAHPDAPLTELARSLRTSQPTLQQQLDELVALGVVRADPAARSGYSPADPRVALSGLIHRRQSELDIARGEMEYLVEDFRSHATPGDPHSVIEVVTGLATVARRSQELANQAQHEIRAFDTPPYASDLEGETKREEPQLGRGVHVLSLYSQAALELPGRIEHVLALSQLGEDARVLPELPIKLHIYDRKLAIVPLVSTRSADISIAVIRESGLLDGLIALFDAYWVLGHPVRDMPADAGTDPVQQQLVPLLAAGLKDESVARQLGLSSRTTGRRIRALLTSLHATSRFQAGVEAMRRGWIR